MALQPAAVVLVDHSQKVVTGLREPLVERVMSELAAVALRGPELIAL